MLVRKERSLCTLATLWVNYLKKSFVRGLGGMEILLVEGGFYAYNYS